jgi:fibronectin type 3 domain-containing protein
MKKTINLAFLILCTGGLIIVLAACPGTNPPETINPEPVTGVTSNLLECTDHIHLSWNPADNADAYHVYRYLSKNEDSCDKSFITEINTCDDNDVQPYKVYYYKVSSAKGSYVSETNTNFIPGLISSIIDTFEPNDDTTIASEIPTGDSKALISSFNDGKDQDWDFYTVSVEGHYSLTIRLPEESPLIEQLLNLTVRTNTGTNTAEIKSTSYKTHIMVTDPVSFDIRFIVPDLDLDVAGEYTLILEEI